MTSKQIENLLVRIEEVSDVSKYLVDLAISLKKEEKETTNIILENTLKIINNTKNILLYFKNIEDSYVVNNEIKELTKPFKVTKSLLNKIN